MHNHSVSNSPTLTVIQQIRLWNLTSRSLQTFYRRHPLNRKYIWGLETEPYWETLTSVLVMSKLCSAWFVLVPKKTNVRQGACVQRTSSPHTLNFFPEWPPFHLPFWTFIKPAFIHRHYMMLTSILFSSLPCSIDFQLDWSKTFQDIGVPIMFSGDEM